MDVATQEMFGKSWQKMRHQNYPEKQRQESETKPKIYLSERSTKEACIQIST